jgi:hypothetical protein
MKTITTVKKRKSAVNVVIQSTKIKLKEKLIPPKKTKTIA